MLFFWLACQDPTDPSLPLATLLETEAILPGPGIPEGVVQQDSRNNLDVVEHEGKIFFAFRTAPSHFASAQTMLYVLSSSDGQSWEEELSLNQQTDLREPRFLSYEGRLFLYFAVLGDQPTDFEPQGMEVSEYLGPQNWTTPVSSYLPGFIPWRARVVDGQASLIGYVGGENIYDVNGEPITIHLLTTTDGVNWAGWLPDQPVVATGGGSETDWVELADGRLLAVSRNEAGDETGFGSKICVAAAGDWGNWDCVGDPKKYDSPLLFQQNGRVWLVGRRNVTETGNYDLGRSDLEMEQQSLTYELDYWTRPKRCSLWTVDPDAQSVQWVLDLPSRGDTCFPSMLPRADGTVDIYNYSSPLEGPDLSWNEGQSGATYIYRHHLRLAEGL